MSVIDREVVSRVVGRVLFNHSNYPERVQLLMLGQDTSMLRELIVNAIVDEVQPVDGIMITLEEARLAQHALREYGAEPYTLDYEHLDAMNTLAARLESLT